MIGDMWYASKRRKHTLTRAPITFCFRIKLIKTNRFRLQWGIFVSGWVANDTIRTTDKYKRSTKKDQRGRNEWCVVRGVWYGSLSIYRCNVFPNFRHMHSLPVDWYVSLVLVERQKVNLVELLQRMKSMKQNIKFTSASILSPEWLRTFGGGSMRHPQQTTS